MIQKTTSNLKSREHVISRIQRTFTTHLKNYVEIHKSFSLLHCNCRSLNKNHDNLSLLLRILNFNFDCIAVSETWLHEHSPTDLFQLDNYKFVHRPRIQGNGGGVGLYVNIKHHFLIQDELSTFHENVFESLFVEITNQNSKVIVGVIYRPPSSDLNTFLATLEEALDKVGNSSCYILGDFNINTLNITDTQQISTNVVRNFVNLVSSFGFQPLIDKPTRVTHETRTLLDNIFTNTFHNISSGVIIDDLSDHYPIFCISDSVLPKHDHGGNQEQNCVRLVHQAGINKFADILSEVEWTNVLLCTDTNLAYSLFMENFHKNYVNCFPVVTVKTPQARKVWCSSGILNSCCTKKKLYRKYVKHPTPEKKAAYDRFRNKLTTVIRIAKFNYYHKEFSNQNIKGTWNAINTVLLGGIRKCNHVNELNENGKNISDVNAICNIFNDYFVSIGQTLSNSIVNDANISFVNYLSPINEHCMFLHPTDESEVFKYLKNLKETSPGHDEINCKVVKVVAHFIAKPLCHIINLSLKNGIIPTDLKQARVVPIYKNNERTQKSNYRPISSKELYTIVYLVF